MRTVVVPDAGGPGELGQVGEPLQQWRVGGRSASSSGTTRIGWPRTSRGPARDASRSAKATTSRPDRSAGCERRSAISRSGRPTAKSRSSAAGAARPASRVPSVATSHPVDPQDESPRRRRRAPADASRTWLPRRLLRRRAGEIRTGTPDGPSRTRSPRRVRDFGDALPRASNAATVPSRVDRGRGPLGSHPYVDASDRL